MPFSPFSSYLWIVNEGDFACANSVRRRIFGGGLATSPILLSSTCCRMSHCRVLINEILV